MTLDPKTLAELTEKIRAEERENAKRVIEQIRAKERAQAFAELLGTPVAPVAPVVEAPVPVVAKPRAAYGSIRNFVRKYMEENNGSMDHYAIAKAANESGLNTTPARIYQVLYSLLDGSPLYAKPVQPAITRKEFVVRCLQEDINADAATVVAKAKAAGITKIDNSYVRCIKSALKRAKAEKKNSKQVPLNLQEGFVGTTAAKVKVEPAAKVTPAPKAVDVKIGSSDKSSTSNSELIRSYVRKNLRATPAEVRIALGKLRVTVHDGNVRAIIDQEKRRALYGNKPPKTHLSAMEYARDCIENNLQITCKEVLDKCGEVGLFPFMLDVYGLIKKVRAEFEKATPEQQQLSLFVDKNDYLRVTGIMYSAEFKGWMIIGNGLKACTINGKKYNDNDLITLELVESIGKAKKPVIGEYEVAERVFLVNVKAI